MTDQYNQVEFPFTINVRPSMFHQGLYDEIEQAVAKRLEGTCVPKIGYIKKGTVQVVKKQLGKYDGAHFTGNATFNMQVRCKACMPYVGQVIPCMVVGKNEIGILATNYQYPAYTMFIMKSPDEPNDAMDSIQKNNYIEAKVVAFKLKAANQMERVGSEYWIVCSLHGVQARESTYQILPSITSKPLFIPLIRGTDQDEVDKRRNELTNGEFDNLKVVKDLIQTGIRDKYLMMLTTESQDDDQTRTFPNVENDIYFNSLFGRNKKNQYIIGKFRDELGENIHQIEVLYSNASSLRPKDLYELEIRKDKLCREHKDISLTAGTVLLYHDIDLKKGTGDHYCPIDFWGNHVKWIVNNAEMLHAPNPYLSQLTDIFCATKKFRTESKTHMGREQKNFIETKGGNIGASILYRDKSVINRAYYKMREFIDFFDNSMFPKTNMKVACIAESPGGFIQALLDQRTCDPKNPDIITGIYDDITTISIGIGMNTPYKQLYDKLRSQPDQKCMINIMADEFEGREKSTNQTNLLFIGGVTDSTDTGDILNPENRNRFYREFSVEQGGKADLVTGDAGKERDKTQSTEELVCHSLILAEIVMALNCQKQGGSFILKIFDMASDFTVNLIQVLSYCYDEIGLFKPTSSRQASSEKYLVCKNFNISEDELAEIISDLERLLVADVDGGDIDLNSGKFYGNCISNTNKELEKAISNYNSYYMKIQMQDIENGIEYTNSYVRHSNESDIDGLNYLIQSKVGSQVTTATSFIQDLSR